MYIQRVWYYMRFQASIGGLGTHSLRIRGGPLHQKYHSPEEFLKPASFGAPPHQPTHTPQTHTFTHTHTHTQQLSPAEFEHLL